MQRLVPDRLAVAVGWLRGRYWWHNAAKRRERALQDMRHLLSGTGREGEVRAAARDHLVEVSVKQVIQWRPWMLDRAGGEGLQHLDEALARGRGAVLVSVHLGAYSVRPLLLHGYPVSVVMGEAAFRQPFRGVAGLRRLTTLQRLLDVGGIPARPPDAYAQLQAALARAEVVAVSFDVPGGHSTPFAGKRAHVRTGAARLAFATGAPLVPVLAGRRWHRIYGRFLEPVHSEDFACLDDLVAHLAALFTEQILARPGQYTSASFLRRLSD